MSYANDLEIVSAFAMQDLPPPVQPQNPVVAPVTKTTVAQADSEVRSV